MKGGAMIVSQEFTKKEGLEFQKALLKLQVGLENTFLDIASMISDKYDVIILIDRGLMDGSAYVDPYQWQCLMDQMGVNMLELRDQRYDAVIHMVTAADGAEEFYDHQTNVARYETIDEANEKDRKLRAAYMGHQKWFLINNTKEGFNDKITRAKEAIHDSLGGSTGVTFYKKFLIKKSRNNAKNILSLVPLDFSKFPDIEEINITEDFLQLESNSGEILEASVERRGFQERYIYTFKSQTRLKGQILHKKRNITAAEYLQYLEYRDRTRKQLKVSRISTIYDHNVLAIFDFFQNINGEPIILIIQLNKRDLDKGQKVPLPSYVEIIREITDEEQYLARNLALEDFKMNEQDQKLCEAPNFNSFKKLGAKEEVKQGTPRDTQKSSFHKRALNNEQELANPVASNSDENMKQPLKSAMKKNNLNSESEQIMK